MNTTSQTTAIEHVDLILTDIQDHIDKKLDFAGFILIALGIEYLGCFLDEKPFTDFGQSKYRFKNGLGFFKNNWYKNNSELLFENFRGPLVHQYRIGEGFMITSLCKNNVNASLHLKEYQGNRILVLEQLFEDYKYAVNKFKNEASKQTTSLNRQKLSLAHQAIIIVPITPENIQLSGSTKNALSQLSNIQIPNINVSGKP